MSSTSSSRELSMKFLLEFNNLWHVVKMCDDLMERMGNNPDMNQHLWVVKAEAKRRLACLEADK